MPHESKFTCEICGAELADLSEQHNYAVQGQRLVRSAGLEIFYIGEPMLYFCSQKCNARWILRELSPALDVLYNLAAEERLVM